METIGVCLRIRPMNNMEIQNDEKPAFIVKNAFQIQTNAESKDLKGKSFTYEFQECFDDTKNNMDIFQAQVKQVVLATLEGINGTVFMYGQTGAGKTFTMLGAKRSELVKKNTSALKSFVQQSFAKQEFNDIGILIYSLMELFKEINRDNQRQYELICSYYEVYNENIYDLLRDMQDMSESLSVISISQNEFAIKNLREVPVYSLEEVIQLIHQGEKNRHYAETILNHQSSRSHTIFKVYVNAVQLKGQNIYDENIRCSTEACINFIDLAGSEKMANYNYLVDDSDNSKKIHKDRAKESQSINKSLFFLTRVIAMKTQRSAPSHIPYRNSTLTKLMKSSLSGNFRTIIILCITPALSQFEQSYSTLRFGVSAKLIENKVDQNLVYSLSENQMRNPEFIMSIYMKTKDQETQLKQKNEEIDKLKETINQLNQEKLELESKLNQAQYQPLNQIQPIREKENEPLSKEVSPEKYERLSSKSGERVSTKLEVPEILVAQPERMNSKSSERVISRYNSKIDGEIGERFNSVDLDTKVIQEQIDKQINQFKAQKEQELKQTLNQCKNYEVQLAAQQEKSRIIERENEEMFKKLTQQNQEISNYYDSHKELEKLINQLRDQNQKLQGFAKQALQRLEIYENEDTMSSLSGNTLSQIEKLLRNCLIRLKNEMERRVNKSPIRPKVNEQRFIKKNSSEENLQEFASQFQTELDGKINQSQVEKFGEVFNQVEIPFDNQSKTTSKFNDSDIEEPHKQSSQVKNPQLQRLMNTIKPYNYPQKQKIRSLSKKDQNYNQSLTPRRQELSDSLQKQPQKQPKPNNRQTIQQPLKNRIENEINSPFNKKAKSIENKKKSFEKIEKYEKDSKDLQNDIKTLASRLYVLTEKFSHKIEEPNKSQNWKTNTQEVIFETESEIGIDSRASNMSLDEKKMKQQQRRK